MTKQATRERCNDRLPSGITCDREIGHMGPHRGYVEQHDEPIFWYDDPDPTSRNRGTPSDQSR